MDQFEQIANDIVEQTNKKIKAIFPEIVAKLAKEIFDTQGTIDGRNWKDNTESTAKRKGRNSPNIDTGLLEHVLSQPGFVMDDAYMDKLPESNKSPKGYKYANDMRNFDDIGRTPADEAIIEKELELRLANNLEQ